MSPQPPRVALGFKDPIYFEASCVPPWALLVCLFIWGFMWDLLVLAPSVGPSGSHWPPLGGLGLGGPIEPSGSPLRPQREAFGFKAPHLYALCSRVGFWDVGVL